MESIALTSVRQQFCDLPELWAKYSANFDVYDYILEQV